MFRPSLGATTSSNWYTRGRPREPTPISTTSSKGKPMTYGEPLLELIKTPMQGVINRLKKRNLRNPRRKRKRRYQKIQLTIQRSRERKEPMRLPKTKVEHFRQRIHFQPRSDQAKPWTVLMSGVATATMAIWSDKTQRVYHATSTKIGTERGLVSKTMINSTHTITIARSNRIMTRRFSTTSWRKRIKHCISRCRRR